MKEKEYKASQASFEWDQCWQSGMGGRGGTGCWFGWHQLHCAFPFFSSRIFNCHRLRKHIKRRQYVFPHEDVS
jgi:hypothetical protein